MPITYAQLIARRVPLTAADAAALAAAADSARVRDGLASLPPAEHVVLHADGTVTFTSADAVQHADPLQALAALLYTLLRLDLATGRRDGGIPGRLMLMLARIRGEIDLPVPSLTAFREALASLGSADPATLAAICARTAVPTVSIGPTPSPNLVELPGAPATTRPRRRGTWLAPAAAFAAGCAVALTFVVATGWKPSGTTVKSAPPTARVEARSTARATRAQTPEGVQADAPRPHTSVATVGTDHSPTPLIARTLTTDAFSPSFATDGDLLFHLGRTEGRQMKASIARDGAVAVTPVMDDAASNFHGAMSPDGTRLAFDSDRDGTRGVYVAEPDGTVPRRVSGQGFATTPSWSPDGTRLAFVKSEPGHLRVWNVWIANLRTGSLTRVSHHRVGQAWRPSWFPDGKRLAYSVEDDLIVADLARGTSRSIRSPEPGHLVRTPAVSPDGHRVVFQVFGDGVWLFDVTSGTMHRVLTDRTAEEFAWSPDGKRIAFHARHVGRWSLWQMSL